MFFYVSFLRTPPQSILQSSSVVFTPQVTNDLRTVPFPTSMDVYYWWMPGPQNVTRLSEPAKLTTWRQENAYKPLQIPPPPSKLLIGAAGGPGIDCSLVLAPAPTVASSVIDLRDPEIGRVPLPVCSLPIRISKSLRGAAAVSSPKSYSSKQEAITRTFRIFDDRVQRQIPLMYIKETVSFDLDKKLWDSGIGLSAWLVRLRLSVAVAGSDSDSDSAVELESPESPESITSPLQSDKPAIVQELKKRLFGYSSKRCNVIELGAGTGIVSLVLAGLRSEFVASSSSSASAAASQKNALAESSCILLSTDLPSSMELMSYNIHTNAALYPNCPPPMALPLDWDDEELPEAVRNVRERGGFDLIVMADVTYNTSSFPALLRTIASLLALSNYTEPDVASDNAGDDDDGDDPGSRREREREKAKRGDDGGPLVLLAYKERDPAERQLWDMMVRETGIVLVCVGRLAGAGGLPVEIWLGKRKNLGSSM